MNVTSLKMLGRGLAVVGAILGLALGAPAAPASAHPEPPASTMVVDAGPYRLAVALYADPPRAGQDLPVLVRPADGQGPWPEQVRVTARPGLGTNATPARTALAPDPDGPGQFAGTIRLPVVGAWLVDVVADGPAGEGHATLSVTTAAPGALPVWLGWAMGLAPLLGVLWFTWWQHRYLRRLEAPAGA